MSPTPETAKPASPGMRSWLRRSLLVTLPLGLAFSAESQAQQPPAWSPQPYAKAQSNGGDLPVNTLRSGAPANNTSEVARWRRVERAPESKPANYSQSLELGRPSAPQPNHSQPNHPQQGFVPQQASQQHLQADPGFTPVARRQPVTPANRISDSAVQPASFAQPASARDTSSQEPPAWRSRPEEFSRNASTPPQGDPGSQSSRRVREIKLANHQEDSLTPPSFSLPQSIPALPSIPVDQEETEQIPPNRIRSDRFDSPSDRRSSGYDDRSLADDGPKRTGIDCDDLRAALEQADITKIRIDTSPSFTEGIKNEGEENAYTKETFVESANQRVWYNLAGEEVAQGRLVDLAYGSVVIEQRDGQRTTYLLNRLSDPDKVYVADAWGVPSTCSLNDAMFDPRNFVATTMTWKASGACHKPLYFEEVQLERYGHEWGPVAQPAISSLNFVKNVVFLPYKMGIHPMNECQYSLGYYRPGSCAPWTVGPIPVSLRGAAAQAAAVGGAAWALP